MLCLHPVPCIRGFPRARLPCEDSRMSPQRRRTPRTRRGPLNEPPPYSSRVFLVSLAERRFFLALQRAVSPHLHVCPKVRVADVILCPAALWKRFGGAISQKHFDFVLANPQSLRVACCIELDDSSHEKLSRRTRDAFLNETLHAADVPLLRFRARASYDSDALRRRIFATLRRASRVRPSSE